MTTQTAEDFLEPIVRAWAIGTEHKALISAAISLKRIADYLEGAEPGRMIEQALNNVADAIDNK